MHTIINLTFNGTVYSHADHWVVILHQMDGLSLFIPLPSANLIKFIHAFDNMVGCQNHIATNDQKIFTLFVSSENMQAWLCTHVARGNLDEVIIFCSSPDNRQYWKDWARRYTEKVRDVIVHNDLDRDLLIFGLKYIKALKSHFQGSQSEMQSLREDYNEICLALMDYLNTQIENQESYLRLGHEAI